MTRLDGFIRRLAAQIACLDAASAAVSSLPGVVYELGLGNGRTYDHLRKRMPDRVIIVFECDLETLRQYTNQHRSGLLAYVGDAETILAEPSGCHLALEPVVLVHNDLGDWDQDAHVERSARIFGLLMPRLSDGAIVVSRVPVAHAALATVDIPDGIRKDKYYMYKVDRTNAMGQTNR